MSATAKPDAARLDSARYRWHALVGRRVRARKSCGHGKPPEDWEVVIQDHQDGYIDRAEYERNPSVLAANAHGRAGGQHSQLRVRKPKTGEHNCRTPDEALAVMARTPTRFCDADIAATLTRLGVRTGQGKTWTAHRVGSIRKVHGMRACRSAGKDGAWLTMREAAARLGFSSHVIRQLIRNRLLPAAQAVPGTPWQIQAKPLETGAVPIALACKDRPRHISAQAQLPMFPDR